MSGSWILTTSDFDQSLVYLLRLVQEQQIKSLVLQTKYSPFSTAGLSTGLGHDQGRGRYANE